MQEIDINITTYSGIAAAVAVQITLFTIIGIYSLDHIKEDWTALDKNKKFMEEYNKRKEKGVMWKDMVKIEDSNEITTES